LWERKLSWPNFRNFIGETDEDHKSIVILVRHFVYSQLSYKVIDARLFKKFATSYGIRGSRFTFTQSCFWTISRASLFHPQPHNPFNITSNTLPSVQLRAGLEAVYFHCMLMFNLDEIAPAKRLSFIFNTQKVKFIYSNLKIKVVKSWTYITACVLWLRIIWYLCITFFKKSTKIHKAIFCNIALSHS